MNKSTGPQAFIDGYNAGRSDRALGWKSRYVLATQPHEGEYLWLYSAGYRAGWGQDIL